MTDTFLDTGGTRIHYRLDGPSGAPVVVLSNSLGTDLSMWDAQVAALARTRQVLRYDTRGHGRSSVPPGPYTIEQLGRDVVALLDQLAIERADFCGISMGGVTGMWLGINAPQRVRKLALCNTAAQIGTAERWNTRIAAIRAGGMAAISLAVTQIWFTPAYYAREAATMAAIRRTLERTSADGYIACCEALRDMDLRAQLGAIRAPALVIAGTHDGSTPPADGRFVADHIAGARYVELDAAHISNIEAEARFTAALTDFLDA